MDGFIEGQYIEWRFASSESPETSPKPSGFDRRHYRMVAIEIEKTGLYGIRFEYLGLEPIVEFPETRIGPVHTEFLEFRYVRAL